MTDLDQLIGLCSRCHHLVHHELLIVSGNAFDGFRFADHDNRAIRADFKARVARYRRERELRKAQVTDRTPELAVSRT
jgi:hypothetical protein